MKQRPLLIARVALLSALVYVLSYGTSWLPNVNFVFFIVFTSGLLFGLTTGVLVGFIGMGLWTLFNPYGPALIPIMIAQVFGCSMSGVIGVNYQRLRLFEIRSSTRFIYLLLAATLCTLMYYIPVSLVDAWMFGPFAERFIGGLLWSFLSLGSNLIIFPLLFPVAQRLYTRKGVYT